MFGFIVIETIVYTPLFSWRLLTGRNGLDAWLLSLSGVAAIAGLLWLGRLRVGRILERGAIAVTKPSLRSWILASVAVGALLRLTWAWVYPASPASDDVIYVELAQQLARGEPYAMAGTRAYWPPGYPLLLSVLLPLTGSVRTLALLLNLGMFVALTVITAALAQRVAGDAPTRVAIVLLAIWPGYVAAAGLPGKELVSMVLLAAIVLLYLRGATDDLGSGSILLAGLLLGFACLVQPSLLLFPAVLLAIDLLMSRESTRSLIRLVIVVVATMIAITPWTYRNYQVFGAFVPISTNGGGNFYRANNPLATGAYTDRGEVDLSGLDELEANRRGFDLGRKWITEHPMSFLRLSVEKQILFLGDDAQGIYATLRRGGLDVPLQVYATAKAYANAFWIAVWVLIGIATVRHLREGLLPPTSAVILFPFLYLYLLHSVFESNSKYHIPALPFIAIAAGMAFSPRTRS